ncbi:hypothetical protein nbrc107696_19460 [Gordonia spumicola]|uniref:Cache domain-containing protein n=1 Tax=Gordonia spumicola TaxID=589161 RepID=A0A7I9V8T1_9ACTN|nr:hypothetical protein nbrc107696_19460 [Gordonia spumicola]
MTDIAAVMDTFPSRVQEWSTALGRTLDAHAGALSAAAVDRIVKPDVEAMLAEVGAHIAGGGFVAASGLLPSGGSFMAWWQGESVDRVDALANLSMTAANRYLDADWYRGPISTGRLTITGPYIDLLCTDEFALTYTCPVPWSGAPAVAGIDVTVADLEKVLTRPLASLGPHAALVNAEGRAIVTASPTELPGDFVDTDRPTWPLGYGLSVVV